MGYKDPAQRREYQRRWLADRRRQWFEATGATCVRCGASEDLVLHFPKGDRRISNQVWSWSDERREKALAEARVVCRKCLPHFVPGTELIEFDGVERSISEWSRELGIAKSTLEGRLRRGWSVERAFTEPPTRSKKRSEPSKLTNCPFGCGAQLVAKSGNIRIFRCWTTVRGFRTEVGFRCFKGLKREK